MRAEVSPPASRFIAPASPSSGAVMERPISQLQTSPISMTTAKPTQAMNSRMRARDAASALAASSALFCAAAMILSASGSTLSVSWLISVRQRLDVVGAGDPLGEGVTVGLHLPC